MNMTTDSIRIACTAQAEIDTPLGTVLLARTAKGLAGLWFEGQKHHPLPWDAPNRPDDALLRRTAAQLRGYFDAEPTVFDLPLDLHGTSFQRAVWRALLAIPVGATVSYGALASQLGTASAVRAVGGAVGRNPVSVIVPCHRVVGTNGSMTGYAGGVDRKRRLLSLERPRELMLASARPSRSCAGKPFDALNTASSCCCIGKQGSVLNRTIVHGIQRQSGVLWNC